MKKRYIFLIICIGLLAVVLLTYGGLEARMRKARFNVFALGSFLHAYNLVEGKPVETLSVLPDVRLACDGEGLEFSAADVRGRVSEGYYYDFSRKDAGKFVISASPLGMTGLQAEYGMLEDLNLRMNVEGVDTSPDSYDEVSQWPILPVWYELRTVVESI